MSKNSEYVLPDHATGGNEIYARPLAPLDDFIAAGKRLGLPQMMLDAITLRHRAINGELDLKTDRLDTKGILSELDRVIGLAFSFLDPVVMAKTNARDLMTIIGIGVDKRQLLSGEPTHILSHGDRKNISNLLPALVAEVERRGLTIEHHVEEATGQVKVEVMKDVTP
jgi:hypothetical protein|tara:strand:+ start:5316 stop:5819 length:504 start_codon:yes stop_codon:yes gene_type:complete